MSVLASLIVVALTGAEVMVTVSPQTPCLEQSQLATKLRAAGVKVVPRAAPVVLVIDVQAAGPDVQVLGRRAERRFERVIPGEEDCKAVERVVVAMISAWSLVAPQAAVASGAKTASPSAPAAPGRTASSSAAPSGTAALSAPVSPIEPATQSAPPAATTSPSRAVSPSEPVAVTSSPVNSRPEGDSRLPWRVEVAALGGLGAGPTSTVVASGALSGSFSLGRWGVLLDGGFEGGRQGQVGPVRAQCTTQWLSLAFRVTFEPIERLTLDAALGARGWRFAATATGVDSANDAVHLAGGPLASLGGSWHVVGPLHVHLRSDIAVRTQPVRFTVEPIGPVLVLNPWHVGARLGALVRFQ